jgi:hypothetical protein
MKLFSKKKCLVWLKKMKLKHPKESYQTVQGEFATEHASIVQLLLATLRHVLFVVRHCLDVS